MQKDSLRNLCANAALRASLFLFGSGFSALRFQRKALQKKVADLQYGDEGRICRSAEIESAVSFGLDIFSANIPIDFYIVEHPLLLVVIPDRRTNGSDEKHGNQKQRLHPGQRKDDLYGTHHSAHRPK